MGYDRDFYNAYRAELARPHIRHAHDRMFRILRSLVSPLHVIDLGCGTCEFARYGNPDSYLGIDLNVVEDKFPVVPGDFTKDLWLYKPKKPTVMTSLFATELVMNPLARYGFYGRCFEEFPSLQAMLVSGLYYDHRRNALEIEEVDSLGNTHRIYQATESPINYQNATFRELRCEVPVAYHMFGPGCVEVWKFLVR